MRRTIDPVAKQQGEMLRELRNARGWNQQTLADKVAERLKTTMSKSAVSAWETGINPPGRETVFALDSVYGETGEVLAIYGVSGVTPLRRLELSVQLLERGLGLLVDLQQGASDERDAIVAELQALRAELRERRGG